MTSPAKPADGEIGRLSFGLRLSDRPFLPRWGWSLLVAWTALVALELWWNMRAIRETAMELAAAGARSGYEAMVTSLQRSELLAHGLLWGMGITLLCLVWRQGERRRHDKMRADDALRESEAKYRRIVETASEGILQTDENFRTVFVSRRMAEMLGYTVEELYEESPVWIFPEDHTDHDRQKALRRQCMDSRYERRFRHRDGSGVWMQVSAKALTDSHGRFAGSLMVATDITERKRQEEERDTTIKLLWLLNTGGDLSEMVRSIAVFMQDVSGCEAVGVRLRDGDDFPYVETRAFARGFVEMENRPCAGDVEGRPLRDEKGNPFLDSIYDDILHGRSDPTKPFFTAHGSFWTHRATQLPESATGADRQTRTRNRCTGQGYESIALVPLRYGCETLGLIRFNDHRPDRFPPEKLSLLERLGDSVAIALAHRKSEMALRESTSLIEATFGSLADAIFVTDPETRTILRCNIAAERIFGYAKEEMEGRSIEILHVDGATGEADHGRRMEAALEAEKPFRESRMRRKNGEVFPTEYSVAVVENASRNRILHVRTVRDITERKHFQDTLRKAHDRYRAVVRVANGVMYQRDFVHNLYTYVDEGISTLLGYPPDEFTPALFQSLIEERIILPYQTRVNPAVEAGEDERVLGYYHACYRMKNRDGRSVWVSDSSVEFCDANGRLTGSLGVFQDITDFRFAQEQHTILVQAIEQAAEAVAIMDPTGTIQYVNPGFEKITGYSSAEVTGNHSLFPREILVDPAGFAGLLGATRQGKIRSERMKGLRKDGSPISMDVLISPILGSSGKATHLTAIMRDATYEVALEEQLRQSQKLEAIGVLAGGVAHDFNNLLTVILGHGKILSRQFEEGNPKRESIGEIEKAARKAAGLTAQLLAFSRKQILKPEILDLNRLVGEMSQMLQRLIGEDILLKLSLCSGPGLVEADPGQMEQVLMNLAVNARDAMPQGGTLTILTERATLGHVQSLEPGLAAGPYLSLEVRDTGHGMDAETRERIFEPFYTTKGVGRGTGLGLSTVYGIVKQSGGGIVVESAPEMGAAFRIYLPQAPEPEEVTDNGGEKGLPSGSETVLLVEDDEMVLNLSRQILANCGYRVMTAPSGSEAMRLYGDHPDPIDLLITDVVMPGISGQELAEWLGAAYPAMKVLFMSGYTDDALLRHGVEGMRVAFLQKPYHPEDLARKARDVLDEPRKT